MNMCMHTMSLQSCLTFCDPMDCSLPDSSLKSLFFRQKYWSRLPCPPPGDLPKPGIEPGSPTLQADSLLTELQGKVRFLFIPHYIPRWH